MGSSVELQKEAVKLAQDRNNHERSSSGNRIAASYTINGFAACLKRGHYIRSAPGQAAATIL